MERMKVVVGRVGDFADGGRKIVDVNGKSIGVFRVGTRFYALRNRCPHQFGPLCVGTLAPRALSDGPGDLRVGDGPPLITCPWHGWEYDLATGQSFMGPGRGQVPALAYEVTVAPGRDVAAGPGARVPGPYVAETVPVSVEEDYVLVDDQPTREKGARS
jgi:nitrite reductase/ring-hydroxylating ferredoxin subunit